MKKTFTLLLSLVSALPVLRAQQPFSAATMVNPKLSEAKAYLTGSGQVKDPAKALTLYTSLADVGEADAMNALGIMYKEGIGVKANKNIAIDWFTRGGNAGSAKCWYNLGLVYKDALLEKERDFTRAYECFAKAADLGDAQSIYAKAYMLYKGLGCQQNYDLAAKLFAEGAYSGRPNSMYFYGLCLRNGYGLNENKDSARFWLTKAAVKGYRQAKEELATVDAENSNSKAKALAATLTTQLSQNKKLAINRFQSMTYAVDADVVEGVYDGYMIKYDWSGKHAVSSAALKLRLKLVEGELTGTWEEEGYEAVPLHASLSSEAMIFENTMYKRKDHYSPEHAVAYNFQDARLQWVRKGDSVLMSGNIQMFSPDRNEPQKPMFISLVRTNADSANKSQIRLVDDKGKALQQITKFNAYPNPFIGSFTVDFVIKEAAQVRVSLLTTDGKAVYQNDAGLLRPGQYRLPVKPQSLSAGAYLVRLQCGNSSEVIKVIKL